MRLLIQRVLEAKVTVDNKIVGKIGPGVLVFLGMKKGDTERCADYLIKRLIHLRMFPDAEGKMNLSILDKGLSALIVSQFTLYANCSEGRRPSFSLSEEPEKAENLYNYFTMSLQSHLPVQVGVFGAKMLVDLKNDGPVTFIVDSK